MSGPVLLSGVLKPGVRKLRSMAVCSRVESGRARHGPEKVAPRIHGLLGYESVSLMLPRVCCHCTAKISQAYHQNSKTKVNASSLQFDLTFLRLTDPIPSDHRPG
jgi:hypothetical protein